MSASKANGRLKANSTKRLISFLLAMLAYSAPQTKNLEEHLAPIIKQKLEGRFAHDREGFNIAKGSFVVYKERVYLFYPLSIMLVDKEGIYKLSKRDFDSITTKHLLKNIMEDISLLSGLKWNKLYTKINSNSSSTRSLYKDGKLSLVEFSDPKKRTHSLRFSY